MGHEDEYIDLVLDGSTYELLRARRGISTRWPIPRKIRWCGYLSFAASALLPTVMLLPFSVREAYFGVRPAFAPMALAIVDLVGVVCLAVGGLGLAAVAVRSSRLEEISEDQAWSLVGIEDAFSGIGLVTGALGVLSALALAGVGFGGLDAVRDLLAAGVDPYLMSGTSEPTVLTASGIAFGCAIVVYLLGVLVESLE